MAGKGLQGSVWLPAAGSLSPAPCRRWRPDLTASCPDDVLLWRRPALAAAYSNGSRV